MNVVFHPEHAPVDQTVALLKELTQETPSDRIGKRNKKRSLADHFLSLVGASCTPSAVDIPPSP